MCLDGYDKWKLDYPSHWDDETFLCDICQDEYDLDSGMDAGSKFVCKSCYEYLAGEEEE